MWQTPHRPDVASRTTEILRTVRPHTQPALTLGRTAPPLTGLLSTSATRRTCFRQAPSSPVWWLITQKSLRNARDVLTHKNTSVDRTTTPACRSGGTERTMRSPARCVRPVMLVGRSVPRHAGCVHVLHKGCVPTSANHVRRSTLQWQNIQVSAPCGACTPLATLQDFLSLEHG